MRVKSLIVSLVMFLAVPAAALAQSPQIVEMNEQMLRPTVQVLAGNSMGSGTVIYSDTQKTSDKIDTLILTNYHVVRDTWQVVEEWSDEKGGMEKKRVAGQISVRFFNYVDTSQLVSQTDKYATIVASNPGLDIALLKLVDETEKHPFVARIAAADARIDQGETVYAVGGGLGAPPFISNPGTLGFNHLWINGRNYTLATASIINGNSGGGLYRDSEEGWELIGIPTMVVRGAWHMGIHVAHKDLREFVGGTKWGWTIGETGNASSTVMDMFFP